MMLRCTSILSVIVLLGFALFLPVSAQTESSTRETPLLSGETGIIGDYEVRVVSTTPDAYDVVMGENSFNDPPEDGQQFYMVRVEVTYVGKESGNPGWDLSYGSVGINGRAYTDSGNSCGSYPEGPFDVGELFPGATAELNICWLIDSSDTDTLVMFVEELISFDDTRVWLSLQP